LRYNLRNKIVLGTVCVSGRWVGVDYAWEQGKLEARKMLENAAEFLASSGRIVGLFLPCGKILPEIILIENRILPEQSHLLLT
jgi:hypothetical protein